MSSLPGPTTPAAIATFRHKYCQPGEGYREVCNRVAGAITDDAAHFKAFREILLDGRFVPGGRNLAALGTTKKVTANNCFVSGTIRDSLNGPGSIMDRLAQASRTMQMGGGIGYDFSTLRPRNDFVRSVSSRASGPVSFIHIFDAMGATISSEGERRGAQMGVLRVDHPDIEEFIHAKQGEKGLNCFNLSVAVTDEFMKAVGDGSSFPLVFEGRTYREVDARTLWDTIMRGTWDWAEPGVLFIDRINEMNNMGYYETIAATNPCSEQPLPPFGTCLLGAWNPVRYLRLKSGPTPLGASRYWFDWAQLLEDIPIVVRAMDNVVDVALYPLEEQGWEAKSTRRMGLGVMGLANCLEAQGFPYGVGEFLFAEEQLLEVIKNTTYIASAGIAKEKGPFPKFDKELYLERPFIQGLCQEAQRAIREHGIRNSHLLTIAPTGTTSLIMDNTSSGIEPVFAAKARRAVIGPNGVVEHDVVDYGLSVLGVEPKAAADVTAAEHVQVLCVAQRHVDSAISKTCNVPSDMPWDAFKGVYMNAWLGGAKGCATFQEGGMRTGIIKAVTECEGNKCLISGTIAS